jgi:putative DNA primase/helicase
VPLYLLSVAESGERKTTCDRVFGAAPQAVSVPRLLYADATPEALYHALVTGWPSAAVISAEAGAVFDAHGKGYQAILRNLALPNVLWDGGEIAVDRRSKPSFRLRDRRLTFGVVVQPEALRGFLERAGALPRGRGFIARFLIA